MIFETIVTLWILYILRAPLWIWIIACLAAIEAFYSKYEQTELKKRFEKFIKNTNEFLDKSIAIIESVKERHDVKETENDSNAE